MATVMIRYVDGRSALRVGDRTLGPGQAATVSLDGPLEIGEEPFADSPEVADIGDVFSPANRPNGIVSAEIAPKLPKSSGELVQFPVEGGDGGAVVERAPAEIGAATQGGGVDAGKDGAGLFRAPGPRPEASGTTAAPPSDATGDVDEVGKPLPRTPGTVEKTAQGQKGPAKR